MEIERLLHLMVEESASDLHLLVPSPPVLRIDGEMKVVSNFAPLTPEDTAQAFASIGTAEQRETLEKEMELDFAYALPDGKRLRCNACFQKGSIALALRLIHKASLSIEDLGLPEICRELVRRPRGLVLVTGPSGCGKSTTLAAMIEYLNNEERCHIVTIEDPVEYLFHGRRSIISQRELGADTRSFASALKHVLRQDPNVIMVGEMRDVETVAAVLTATETGHLVLSTGHAPSASQSMERIIDLFPPEQQHQAQKQLGSLLEGVVCQTLIPKLDVAGRVPAVEVMLATTAVRNIIREGKFHQLPSVIATSSGVGMQTLDQDLARLYHRRLISRENATARCQNREEFERLTHQEILPAANMAKGLLSPLDSSYT